MGLWILLLASLTANAGLSKQERETAKSMTAGTLYLRLDVPCKYGRGGFGLSMESLLEVSPAGYDIERKLNLPSKQKHESVYWGFFPNDAVHYAKLSFNSDSVQVWMEGAPPDRNEIMIDFIQINTMDDFVRAFNQTFSKVPLQDEHQEWPAEVRKAIAERKVVEGMSKEQAFCVVGKPINVVTGNENGVKVETWFPRQDRGTVVTFRREKSTRTGFPALLKFVDGRLKVIEQTPRAPELSGK
jgi:hypothetical protein